MRHTRALPPPQRLSVILFEQRDSLYNVNVIIIIVYARRLCTQRVAANGTTVRAAVPILRGPGRRAPRERRAAGIYRLRRLRLRRAT